MRSPEVAFKKETVIVEEESKDILLSWLESVMVAAVPGLHKGSMIASPAANVT